MGGAGYSQGGGKTSTLGPSGLDTSAMSANRFAYVSATNVATPTDADSLNASETVGVFAGVAGELVATGAVTAAFTTAGGQPVAGRPVYLAPATEEADAAGKLTATRPSSSTRTVSEVGVVLDASLWAAAKTAVVQLQQKRAVSPPFITSGWSTVYEVDFSTLPTQDLIAGGAFTIDGIGWTVENVAKVDVFAVTNGTGLQINLKEFQASTYYNGTRTAPIITAPITTFFPAWDETLYRLRVSVGIPTMTLAYNLATGGAKVGFEMTSAPTTHNVWMNRTRNGGAAAGGSGTTRSGITTAQDVANSDQARQIQWDQFKAYLRTAASYGSAWTTRYLLRPVAPLGVAAGAQNIEAALLTTSTNWRLMLLADNSGTGGGGNHFQTTFSKLKLEVAPL
jgi:hypothetical protein